MLRLIVRTIGFLTAAVVLLTASALAFPQVRHFASAWWHDPTALRALPDNPQVHYEAGADERARLVAALLPAAVARVEEIHGRRFAYPVTVAVYVSREAFSAADGSGSYHPVGVTFRARVILSPALFARQRRRLPAILTHELSHAHLQTWISPIAFLRLPHWFAEGLAVMVSSGGGAEGVSEAQARTAIIRGRSIAIEDSGSLLKLTGIDYVHPPETPNQSFRIQMAYRQAGMFAGYLRDSNPAAFATMIDTILDGRPLVEAVARGYHTDLSSLWSGFVESIKNSK